MMQYLVIMLDDSSVSYCHYARSREKRKLMPLDTLREGIRYAMRENLNVQFLYPSYELPPDYQEAIDSIDHADIKPVGVAGQADVVVLDGWEDVDDCTVWDAPSYVLRTDKEGLFAHVDEACGLLDKLTRLNIVLTDVETFGETDYKRYAEVLQKLADKLETIYLSGGTVQFNLLTDRMMLDKMNNCGAGDTTLTLAPDGQFYACPAFYLAPEEDGIGRLRAPIGDLKQGLNIKNGQLYKLDHAPICRRCDAYQCKRCVWLNRTLTFEVNTPSHQQCVVAHLERNASRLLLQAIRCKATFLPERDGIKKIDYLDPFDVRED